MKSPLGVSNALYKVMNVYARKFHFYFLQTRYICTGGKRRSFTRNYTTWTK